VLGMDDGGGVYKLPSWLWDLIRPAVIAMIVALLVSLGVQPAGRVEVAGVSHFSSVYSNDDVQAADDLIAGDDVTVGDDITCDVITAADLAAIDDLQVGDDASIGDDLSCDVAVMSDVWVVDDSFLGDDVWITGTLTVADVTVSAAGTVGTFLNVSGVTAISCTDGGVITMTGTYQPLEAAGNVTPTLSTTATGLSAGSLLCLVNTANVTITIADSGTAMLSGNLALGQYDSAWLIFDGTNWIEISEANN